MRTGAVKEAAILQVLYGDQVDVEIDLVTLTWKDIWREQRFKEFLWRVPVHTLAQYGTLLVA